MNNLNNIIIEGNIVKDPSLRKSKKGNPVVSFSIASNRFFKRDSILEKETSFFDVEAWDDLGVKCNDLGHKGRACRVTGRLRQDKWEGANGPRSKVVIVAMEVEFRPDKKEGEFPEREQE
jgi:single-strand DNA-binding protein